MLYQQAEREGRIAVSAITEAELRYGLEKKPEATKLRAYVMEFLQRTECLPWDTAAAKVFSTLRAKTEALGLAFGAIDLLIAAHASALDATLVTHDRVLHRAAAFLPVIDWATDV